MSYLHITDIIFDYENRTARVTPPQNHSYPTVNNITEQPGMYTGNFHSQGRGVLRSLKISKDDYCSHYFGLVLNEQSYIRLASKTSIGKDRLDYVILLHKYNHPDINGNYSTYINASGCGSHAGLINHSCSPNCKFAVVVYHGRL